MTNTLMDNRILCKKRRSNARPPERIIIKGFFKKYVFTKRIITKINSDNTPAPAGFVQKNNFVLQGARKDRLSDE